MKRWYPFESLENNKPLSYSAPFLIVFILSFIQFYIINKPFMISFIHSCLIALLLTI